MDRLTPSGTHRDPLRPSEVLARQQLHHACYALGGARGLQRKLAKQDLIDAMERLQRLAEGDLEPE
jgi:hypothetical protein